MDMERITLPSGQVCLVEPKKAAEVRQRMAELEQKNRRLGRELRQSRLLPQSHRNSTAKWTGSNHCWVRSPAPRTAKQDWADSKKKRIEDRWNSFKAEQC